MCIHCLLRKQKCRLKSTTTNGWRHFGQSEQRKSSALFPIQSEKSPDSGIFTCDPTKKCIMPSSRERHKGIIGRGHDLRLGQCKTAQLSSYSSLLLGRLSMVAQCSQVKEKMEQKITSKGIIIRLLECCGDIQLNGYRTFFHFI